MDSKIKNNELPDGWGEVELGQIVDFVLGQAPSSKSYNEKGEGTLFVRAGDFGDLYPNPSSYTTEPISFGKEGDVFLCVVGATSGKINLGINASITRSIYALRPKLILAQKYLYYFLKTQYQNLNNSKSGSAQGILNKAYLSQIKIPLPPLPTQKKIVSILEKAEKIKQQRAEADKLTREYLQSVFYEMFGNPVRNERGWKIVQSQNIFDMKLGKMLSAANYTGKDLKPYLRNINVQWGRIDLSDIKEMDFDDEEFKRYKLERGDILVCEGGEVGRTAIYNGEISNCCYQNALHRLRIKSKSIEPFYFVYYMMLASKYGLIERDTIQVTIAHFTLEKFKKFRVPLPPIALQQEFSAIVEKTESVKEKQKKSREEIDNLFNSLMQRAFNGGLVK